MSTEVLGEETRTILEKGIWFTGVEGILDAVDGELLVVVYSRYVRFWGCI